MATVFQWNSHDPSPAMQSACSGRRRQRAFPGTPGSSQALHTWDVHTVVWDPLSSNHRSSIPSGWVSVSPRVTGPSRALSEQVIGERAKDNTNASGQDFLCREGVRVSCERVAQAGDAGSVYGRRKGYVESHLMLVA